ncbi:MAG: reverse transcriptase domain-containing protein, partial [bacterium]
MTPKELVIQCLKTIQGTRDAGQRWYLLISGCLIELRFIRCSCDHGVFILTTPEETCYIALETDDLLFISKTRAPFLRLKASLEQLFDLTVCEGSVLKFLNLR